LTKTEKQRIDFSDAKRFKAEYEAYFSALKYFAFRYIEDEEVVCDLLQDLFVKLWERGEMFENEMVLKAYLYRSVRNNCLTYIRDNRRREHRLAEYEPEETEEAFVDRSVCLGQRGVRGVAGCLPESLPQKFGREKPPGNF